MGRVVGKKLFSIMALCAMISLLLLPIAVSLPSLALGADAPDAVKKEGEAKVEKGRDVYYKTEGIVVGALPRRPSMALGIIRGTTSRAACCSGLRTSSTSITEASCSRFQFSAWLLSSWGR